MKRTERHHLKENELVHSITSAREFMETRKSQITGAMIGDSAFSIMKRS